MVDFNFWKIKKEKYEAGESITKHEKWVIDCIDKIGWGNIELLETLTKSYYADKCPFACSDCLAITSGGTQLCPTQKVRKEIDGERPF